MNQPRTRALDFYQQELKPTLAPDEMVIAQYAPGQLDMLVEPLCDATVLTMDHAQQFNFVRGEQYKNVLEGLWAQGKFLQQVFYYFRAHASICWYRHSLDGGGNGNHPGQDDYVCYVKAVAYFFNQGCFFCNKEWRGFKLWDKSYLDAGLMNPYYQEQS